MLTNMEPTMDSNTLMELLVVWLPTNTEPVDLPPRKTWLLVIITVANLWSTDTNAIKVSLAVMLLPSKDLSLEDKPVMDVDPKPLIRKIKDPLLLVPRDLPELLLRVLPKEDLPNQPLEFTP